MWHGRSVDIGSLLNRDRRRKLGAFGGTSILIVVSVTMDTVAQIQSQLLAHQYEGLIKKAKLRGRGGQSRGKGVTAPVRR